MNAHQRKPVDCLSPESAALVETFFARVHGALLVAAAGECEDTVDDLREHVLERLAGSDGTPSDVTRVLAELGTPEALAAQCADVVAQAPAHEPESGRLSLSGTLLGMPYDLRPPTGERVVAAWWDPQDPHVVVPRVFGLGWTINFGALAVATGLVRPDDEDAPFASVPERCLVLALGLPLLAAAVLAVLVAAYQGGLPQRVAVHWALNGLPDGFASKGSALILPVGMTLLGLVLAIAAWVRRRAALARVGAGALATMLASISVAAYAQEVATAYGARDSAILLSGLVLSLVLTFALLVTLSRIGHAAEVRRDLVR
jgi:hypothetical protein